MSQSIAGWKFVAELPQSSGDVLPRVLVVRLLDRDAAAKAVWQQFPGANFRADHGQPRTAEELDSDLGKGNGFLPDEYVRITDEI